VNDPRQRFVYTGGPVPKIMDTLDNTTVCYMQIKDRGVGKTEAMGRVMTEALNKEALRRAQAERPAPAQGRLPAE